MKSHEKTSILSYIQKDGTKLIYRNDENDASIVNEDSWIETSSEEISKKYITSLIESSDLSCDNFNESVAHQNKISNSKEASNNYDMIKEIDKVKFQYKSNNISADGCFFDNSNGVKISQLNSCYKKIAKFDQIAITNNLVGDKLV